MKRDERFIPWGPGGKQEEGQDESISSCVLSSQLFGSLLNSTELACTWHMLEELA